MKKVQIKKGSFWYEVAEIGDGYLFNSPVDICEFRRACIWGIFKVLFFSFPFIAIETMLAIVAYDHIAPFALPFIVSVILAILAPILALVIIGGVIVLIAKGLDYYYERKEKKRLLEMHDDSPKELTAFGQMYQSWKQKYCVQVEIVEKDDA